MAFDPDKYLADKQAAQGFDPDKYLADKAAAETTVPYSQLESAAMGVANGGTFGFADELGGAGQAAYHAITGSTGPLAGKGFDDLVDDYQKSRDELRNHFKQAKNDNPYSYLGGQVAGGIAGTAAAAAATGGLGLVAGTGLEGALVTGEAVGAAQGLGNSDADLTKGNIGGAAADTVKGAGIGALAGGAGYGLGKLATKLAPTVRNIAEDSAVNATGATGKQADKFADDAGRQLLDRKIVTPFSNASGIAEKAEGVLNDSRNQISNSLGELDNQGATLNRDDVVSKIQSHIDELRSDPSQSDVVKRLQNIQQSVSEAPENVSLSAGEQTKRGFQDLSNYQDPVSTRANKIAAGIYRDGVEDSAQTLNPELASKFTDAKDTYGLIAPIREAAAKRAATLNQSPIGGFSDLVAGGAGFLKGGPVGAIAAPVLKRTIAPRLASTVAVGADGISNFLTKSPEIFGKYAGVLQAAAARSPQSLAVTHYLLQQNDPAFREKVQGIYGDGTPENDGEE